MRAATSLAALLLAGCATHGPGTPSSGTDGLSPQGWVDRALAPELARELRTHPRFRGETLSLGLPAEAAGESSRLDRVLEARLEEHLLAEPGVRIRPPAQGGCGVGDTAYRIGFVTSVGPAVSTIQARVWDTEATEWVAGVGGRWEGVLTGPDARAAASPADVSRPAGTLQQPFAAGDPAPLAHALAERLECALAASGLAGGPVTTAQDGVAAVLALRLSARLAGPAGPQPAWVLSVTPVAVDENRELLLARLASDAGAVVTASAYRRTRESGVRDGAANARPARAAAPRLAPLACGSHCVGVRSSGAGEAVLVAVLAGRGLFSLEGCGAVTAGDGERTVRLHDPDLPWASFYAIAADADTRPALAALAARLPRACGSGSPQRGGDRRWLESLADLADGPSAGLAWNGLRVAAPLQGDMP